ncbi:MAG: bifunctional phosphoglucose/phosphomannose isomerase [Bacteroidota bacterium]
MMYQLIEGFGTQLKQALLIGKKQTVTPPRHEIRNVVIAGLGGSGIGGSLVAEWTTGWLSVPVQVIKSYDIPNYVDQHTLFIASSFSGGTEETLAALEKALPTGAKVACITSGGTLMSLAQETPFDAVQIPNEAPCPRAFLGYSFVQLMYLLKHYQLLDDTFETALEAGIEQITTHREKIQQEAQTVAKAYHGRLPIIYADSHFSAVIMRLQQQINENAKQLCHTHVFPEMNHNELVGWQQEKNHYQNVVVTMLRSSLDTKRVKIRMDICEPIFKEKAAQFLQVVPQGTTLIEQSLYLIHLFDWLSFYLAELNQVDPFPVSIIGHLKSELAKVSTS